MPSWEAVGREVKRRPWAKVVALVAGILSFPAFPIGTGVGLYAIWVFLQDDTETCLVGYREPGSGV